MEKNLMKQINFKQRLETEHAIIHALVKVIEQNSKKDNGVLHALKKGFKCLGARFKLMQPPTSNQNNAKIQQDYENNILRVIPELEYSDRNNNRLDLCLFVNGLPTATVELKTDFTQSVYDAINQYKKDRPPKNEPLLTFGRGALVHFALSTSQAYMTTKLDGKKTNFLPFNQGNNGGAGNPQNPNGYDTEYVWQKIWHKDNWLDILQNYIHMKDESVLIFPRYHQWDCVQKITHNLKTTPYDRKRYLIQHSAGSGKTNSIAWLAHKLTNQYDGKGQNMEYASVIVITDRTILDAQLQQAITKLDPTNGIVVKSVVQSSHASKSEQLAKYLTEGSRIIVVTLQTFPYALKKIQSDLSDKKFAIIADEAHSSQSGTTARNIRTDITTPTDTHSKTDAEDDLNNTVEKYNSKNLSLFAFTATPKDKTIQIFGALPSPDMIPNNENNIPTAFHTYTMKQAIEEGFILNVLENHTYYEQLYQLSVDKKQQDKKVKQRKGTKKVKQWVTQHPTTIGQKVQIIVNHFQENVQHLLDGQAKAMVVTSGRLEVVRYKTAFDDYLQKENITDIQTLVAFSGTVTDADQEYTENTINTITGHIANAFKTHAYNILLVANKFQTGFDQPKLVAMYVDKKISNIECVQTLSRLNRCYPRKDKTFILDFQNPSEWVVESFSKYYKHTLLEGTSDPNHVYTLYDNLLAQDIFNDTHVQKVWNLYIQNNMTQAKLYSAMAEPVDIFRKRYYDVKLSIENAKQNDNANALKQAEKDLSELNIFRKNVSIFVNFYNFITQVIDFQDAELDQQQIFCKYFAKLIQDGGSKENIDIQGVKIDFMQFTKHDPSDGRLPDKDGMLKPTQAVGTQIPKTEQEIRLQQIIDAVNTLFNTINDKDFTVHEPYLKNIAQHIEKDNIAIQQIRESNGDAKQVLQGNRFKTLVEKLVIDDMERAEIIMKDAESIKIFHKVMYDYIRYRQIAVGRSTEPI